MQIISLNLNGIRSAASKGLGAWVGARAPDFLCVQELKAQIPDLEKEGLLQLGTMQGYFHCAEKKGYSGVGIYTAHKPSDVRIGFGNAQCDAEGRWIELRFDSAGRKLSIISSYFPSGSSGEERQAAKFHFLAAIAPHIDELCAEPNREIVLCGDINIAHHEKDLKNWKGNLKNSGFLPEERAWLSQLLRSDCAHPLLDVYRHLEPEATGDCYTWWSQRGQAWAKNVGWRIDYQIASASLAKTARSAYIEKTQRFSDHAPLCIEYEGIL